MTLESLASGAKEQRNRQKYSDVDRFYGELDERKMQLAGARLLQLFNEKGKQAAANFYIWLHIDTKRYLTAHAQYRNFARLIELVPPEFKAPSGDEWLDECREYFRQGRYSKALKLVISNLGDDWGLREAAPVCAIGHDRIKELCSSGRYADAMQCARVFRGFKFEVYLEMYGPKKADKKHSNHKLIKAKRRD